MTNLLLTIKFSDQSSIRARYGLTLFLQMLIACGAIASQKAFSFPEYVRLGYASCMTCHVSPTGGGLLTQYGRGASEEFMATWFREGENGPLEGSLKLPDWLLAGGDLRGLAFSESNGAFKAQGIIPMQAEIEGGARLGDHVTAVASLGAYDGDFQSQRHYLMATANEHLFARAGTFFPAFGVYTPEHETPTRNGLGFGEGEESNNVEVGLVGDVGEVIIDRIFSPNQDQLSNQEKGYSARAAWYAGGKSQLGVSAFSGQGTVWDRSIYGLFAIAGLTKSVYLVADVDQESKTPVNHGDPSTLANTRIVTADKVGWEFVQGLHALVTYEASVTTKGSFDPREWASGPGVQWFPRPHFELLAQAQDKYDETWAHRHGYLLTLMGHYYL